MRTSELNNSVCGAKKGPNLPQKGPNKTKLTCTILRNTARINPLEPLPEADFKTSCGFLRSLVIGRGERIRTSGLYVPNVALYQAKLHPDKWAIRYRMPKQKRNSSKADKKWEVLGERALFNHQPPEYSINRPSVAMIGTLGFSSIYHYKVTHEKTDRRHHCCRIHLAEHGSDRRPCGTRCTGRHCRRTYGGTRGSKTCCQGQKIQKTD